MYNFIETQINELLKLALINDRGEFDAGKMSAFIGPQSIPLIIAVLTSLVYLMILSVVGIYLWNHGIHAMAPNVISSFGNQLVSQNPNQFIQLFTTLLAMVMFF
jgi:hypothetical protein